MTDEICPECGRNLVIKYGPHGKFLACPGFPDCRFTMPYLEKSASIALNAVRMLYLRKQGREENTMAVLTTLSVIYELGQTSCRKMPSLWRIYDYKGK